MPQRLAGLVRQWPARAARLRLWCDAMRFAKARADYYQYLADIMAGLQGRKTLCDIFEDDAHRYGPGTVRGRLAGHWFIAFQVHAGDAARTLAGTLPAAELALLAAGQAAGGAAFTATLRDLARAARLIARIREVLTGALAGAAVAVGVALLVLGAVPFFTVPRLQQVFQEVPAAARGPLSQALFGLAAFLRPTLPFWLAAVIASCGWLLWSLPNLTGPLRARLDHHFIWRLYRDFHGTRFLAMLAVLLPQRGNADTRLREALVLQTAGASPWLASHLEAMMARIDIGLAGADALDTGLIDRPTWWYLSDMIAARGIETGMALARDRIENSALARVRRQALTVRWVLLLTSVAFVLGLTLWHYSVIDELRRALMNVYAS